MQQVNGVQVYKSDPSLLYEGLESGPTWFSAQGGVYQCYDRSTRQPIAIKKYLVEDTQQQGDLFVMPQELVENEIYTMTKCNSDNILKLLSVHLSQEFVYLVMPLCAGGSLQQYVFDHHLTFGQLAHIVASIAAGLEEIHRHGYIHRDIKCDNIFLDDEMNKVVIGDFGVVSITPAADSSVEEAGVVLFWAPELVQGKMVNRKVDIWALGIVILEIINGGRAPYEDEKLDEDEIKQRILKNGKPAYPHGLPPSLIDLLDKCLHLNPRARASASDVLKHPFLFEFKHEPLFESVTDQPSLASIDPSAVDEDSMLNALKVLQGMAHLEDMDCSGDPCLPALSDTPDSLSSTQSHYVATTTTTPTAKHQLPTRKCRLPIRSFVLDKTHAVSIPAKDKVAGVLLKRQSLSDKHRSQGSRLPMLKTILETPPPLPPHQQDPLNGRKLRKARSVRISPPSNNSDTNKSHSNNKSPTSATAVRKPLIRSKTLPLQKTRSPPQASTSDKKPTPSHRQDIRTKKESPPLSHRQDIRTKKESPPPSLPQDLRTKKESPPPSHRKDHRNNKKEPSSSPPPPPPDNYRQKRLPDSRTARLMMGISTTGRRTSKTAPEPEIAQKVSTTAKRLSSNLTASLSARRPVSGLKSSTKSPPPPLPQDKPPSTPAKSRRRFSTPAKATPPPPPPPQNNGKPDSLKGMKMLWAY